MSTVDIAGFLSTEAEDGRTIFRQKYDRLFALLDELNTIAIAKLKEARLADTKNAQFVLYLLGLRVIESFEAIVLMLERGMVASAKLVIRPQLEALFTIAALNKDHSLLAKYFNAHDEAQYRKLKASTKWRADALKEVFKADRLEAHYISQKARRKTTPKETLKPFQWAKAADMDDFYNTFYLRYSSYTHSNREALEENIDSREDGTAEAAFGPCETDYTQTARDSAAFTLLAIMHMCQSLQVPFSDELERIHTLMELCESEGDET